MPAWLPVSPPTEPRHPTKAEAAKPRANHPEAVPAAAHQGLESSPTAQTPSLRPPLPRTPQPSPARRQDLTLKTRRASAPSDPSRVPVQRELAASSNRGVRAQSHPAPNRSHAPRAAREVAQAER